LAPTSKAMAIAVRRNPQKVFFFLKNQNNSTQKAWAYYPIAWALGIMPNPQKIIIHIRVGEPKPEGTQNSLIYNHLKDNRVKMFKNR